MYYRQVTHEERYQIEALLDAGHTRDFIASQLSRSACTIRREIHRNSTAGFYRAETAILLSAARRAHNAANARTISEETWEFAKEKLRETWSPQQISEHLRAERKDGISYETIYQRIYADKREGGDLHLSLRRHKPRRKRRGVRDRRGKIPNQVSIEERPAIVDRKTRIGDWEADLVIGAGRSQALVTINERKSRYALLQRVPGKQAASVRDAIVDKLQPFSHLVHTLTTDNGKEFALHEQIAEKLDLKYYFAHPYASWERGANENMNGLVRQFFPKNKRLEEVTDEEIALAQDRLNHRPRKCLGYKTPHQVFWAKVNSSKPVALRT